MEIKSYSAILSIIKPNSSWSMENENYDTLKWLSPEPKPTKEFLDQEIIKYNNLLLTQQRQSQIQKLLLESDYIELPSFLERKGVDVYNQWMTYRAELRLAYHDSNILIPEKPE